MTHRRIWMAWMMESVRCAIADGSAKCTCLRKWTITGQKLNDLQHRIKYRSGRLKVNGPKIKKWTVQGVEKLYSRSRWMSVGQKLLEITVLILNINNLVKLWPNYVNYDLQIICVIINLEGNDRFGIKIKIPIRKFEMFWKFSNFLSKFLAKKWIFW